MIEMVMSLDEARAVQKALSGNADVSALHERLSEVIRIYERLAVIHHREIVIRRVTKK